MGDLGGTFDPPTYWYEVEREVLCRFQADFINISVMNKHKTAPTYHPVNEEDAPLKGRCTPLPLNYV